MSGRHLRASAACLVLAVALAASADPARAQELGWVMTWSTSGPSRVAVSPKEDTYVVDRDLNRVVAYGFQTGAEVVSFGGMGTAAGRFHDPLGMTVDVESILYVVDSTNNRIQKFSPRGVFASQWGSQGSQPGQFNFPRDVATDPDRNVFVVEQIGTRVQKFTVGGEFLLAFGEGGSGPGEFSAPKGITADEDGNVYVADSGNHRIQKFSGDGSFLLEWGRRGGAPGQFKFPEGLTFDGEEVILVADTGNNRIQAFSTDGTFRRLWTGFDQPDQDPPAQLFLGPTDVAVNKSRFLIVADSGNTRVLLFSPPPTPVRGTTWGRIKAGVEAELR